MYITPSEIWCWSQYCGVCCTVLAPLRRMLCAALAASLPTSMVCICPSPKQTNKQGQHTTLSTWLGAHNTLCTSMLSAPGGVVPYGASSASSFNARSRTPFNNSNALSHHGQSSRINIVMRPILHVYCISAALVSATRQEGFRFVDVRSNSTTSTVTEGLQLLVSLNERLFLCC